MQQQYFSVMLPLTKDDKGTNSLAPCETTIVLSDRVESHVPFVTCSYACVHAHSLSPTLLIDLLLDFVLLFFCNFQFLGLILFFPSPLVWALLWSRKPAPTSDLLHFSVRNSEKTSRGRSHSSSPPIKGVFHGKRTEF